MHQGFHGRAPRRRGAPARPKRRNRSRPNPFLRPISGFEGLIPPDSAQDFFFSGWIRDPDLAAEVLEHGEDREAITPNPRLGVTISAGLHLLLVAFLLIEPTLDFLAPRDAAEEEIAPEREPLVVFMEEPQEPLPPAVVTPVVPAPTEPAQPAPAPEPPPVADDRMLIPKAMLPSEKPQEFMNDLPFSEGNAEEFYTDEEVKEPGEEGEPEETPAEPEDPVLAAEAGEDESHSEPSEGEEDGTGGAEGEQRLDPAEVAELLFGTPDLRDRTRPMTDIRPPEPKPVPGKEGDGGDNGAFTDIRRFLAGTRFDNLEGGLVANTGNTLYYNDKGANFVPWLRRMLAEVRRNWFVPYSVAFNQGHVAIGISVARDGSLLEMKVLIPSGISGFDNAAVGALRAAQLLPLPADYPDDRFEIILVFWYNERPYDLFG